MRFARLATEVFHNEDYQFEIGKAEVIRAGSDVSIIACGLMVPEAMAAAEQLAAKGISAEVINMATIKPLDEAAVLATAKKTGKVITVEEHSIIGGLGEAVCSVLSEQRPRLCAVSVLTTSSATAAPCRSAGAVWLVCRPYCPGGCRLCKIKSNPKIPLATSSRRRFFVAKRAVLCYYELAGIYCYCSLAYKEEFL